ncbi:uncharacterized protein C8Q71DRAFT_188168 [Rhodofomes roseus]|uniref:Uncharacterized protein n=1 Tax=Rhodofomes roseus TaxID=34475 RepID=A0ABQ8K8J6_9APHY|nr:uncharacterized protein C8Q71DRAFT_188168 [Rhodofomes roseus]KAH9833518.1 hypothetical protein C8Q71DRAFT_188168 [Rhodofomes roseus]
MDMRNRLRPCAGHQGAVFPHPGTLVAAGLPVGLSSPSRPYTTGPQPPATKTTPSKPNGRFAPYKQALNAIAERTRTPLPSLVLSFAVLHELTAIVPLAAFFLAARTLNVGERVIKAFPDHFAGEATSRPPYEVPLEEIPDFWIRLRRRWWYEGEQMAERVGRRYGLFGFPKNGADDASPGAVAADVAETQESPFKRAAPDILNFSFAYFLTKSLIPVRIGASLYLSPVFSRRVIEPTRTAVMRVFRRGST